MRLSLPTFLQIGQVASGKGGSAAQGAAGGAAGGAGNLPQQQEEEALLAQEQALFGDVLRLPGHVVSGQMHARNLSCQLRRLNRAAGWGARRV